MVNLSALGDEDFIKNQLNDGLPKEELAELTNQIIERILGLIAACNDSDVTFTPNDPKAYDPAAEDEKDLYIAWTLGHVIVHTTASAEESAALAAELARGVPYRGGRSRFEVPWQEITSIQQCRDRLEESRRMRLASLNMWPEAPHLGNSYENNWFSGQINATVQFLLGLSHEYHHLGQIAAIVRQSQRA